MTHMLPGWLHESALQPLSQASFLRRKLKFDSKLHKNLRNQDIFVFVKHNSAKGSFKMDKKVQQKMQHETKTLQGQKTSSRYYSKFQLVLFN